MNRYISILFLLVWISANCQIPVADRYLLSPTAAGLGEYGEVPVSLYTGLPNIEIPIYTIEHYGYNLPITLNYHSGGIRPNQHPGWVGVGWSLQAGGCISRVINGLPDEAYYRYKMTNKESEKGIGYIFTTDSLREQYANQNDLVYMINIDPTRLYNYYYGKDKYPDMFSFNFCGISGSFCLNSTGDWVIQCNRHVKIVFDIFNQENYIDFYDKRQFGLGELSLNTHSYTIKGFTIIDDTGIRYIFGGDINSTEFSVGFFSQATQSMYATTWMLKKIIYPNGEKIEFDYVKKEYTIQLSKSSYKAQYNYSNNLQSGSIIIPQAYDFTTTDGSLISPSYLSSIKFGSNMVKFEIAESKELEYSGLASIIYYATMHGLPNNLNALPYLERLTASGELRNGIINTSSEEDLKRAIKWYKLKAIKVIDVSGNIIKHTLLNYNDESNTTIGQERLALMSVSNATDASDKYMFEYNNLGGLPEYNTLKTDHGGYYNGCNIIDSDFLGNAGVDYYAKKQPNAIMGKYGILQKIYYPTGGYSRFIYESNTYSKKANNNRTEHVEQTPTQQGVGFRIKQIISSATGKNTDEIIAKEYIYKDSLNTDKSSGVLIHNPQYYASGNILSNRSHQYNLHVWSSESVLPMSGNSVGIHLGYTTVYEFNHDGSYSKYTYSNFDNGYADTSSPYYINNITNFFQSYSLRSERRGLLLKKEEYDSVGQLKYSQHIKYKNDNTTKITCIDKKIHLLRNDEVFEEIYCFDQYMSTYFPRQIINTEYLSNNQTISDTIENIYHHNYNRLIETSYRTLGNGEIERKEYRYPFDMVDTTSIQMTNSNMVSPIIELTTDILIECNEDSTAEIPISKVINKYHLTNPTNPYMINISSKGGTCETRYRYIFDSKNNPIAEYKNEKEQTIYVWGYNYRYIVAVISNTTFEEINNHLNFEQFASSLIPNYGQLDNLKTELPHIKMTRYEYIPLVGLSKIITDEGLITQYFYDSSGRLLYIKDNEGYFNQILDYNYRKEE